MQEAFGARGEPAARRLRLAALTVDDEEQDVLVASRRRRRQRCRGGGWHRRWRHGSASHSTGDGRARLGRPGRAGPGLHVAHAVGQCPNLAAANCRASRTAFGGACSAGACDNLAGQLAAAAVIADARGASTVAGRRRAGRRSRQGAQEERQGETHGGVRRSVGVAGTVNAAGAVVSHTRPQKIARHACTCSADLASLGGGWAEREEGRRLCNVALGCRCNCSGLAHN